MFALLLMSADCVALQTANLRSGEEGTMSDE